MSDMLGKVTEGQDPLKKLIAKIPGFDGFIDRENRRAADKLLRESIADHYAGLHKKLTNIQADLASAGEIMVLDDIEKCATKIQTFMDKIRTASYGYSGFFDAVKINEEELAKLYAFDAALLDRAEAIEAGIDAIEAAVGTDGLEAAIKELIGLTRDLVAEFEKRNEVITSE